MWSQRRPVAHLFAGDSSHMNPIDVALLATGAHEQQWFLKGIHMTPAEPRLRIAGDGLMWLHVIECSLIA